MNTHYWPDIGNFNTPETHIHEHSLLAWVFMNMCSRSIEVAYARPVVSVHVYVFQEY
jgi:hypothetical protein